MSLTPSTMLKLETSAPDFALPDVVSGKDISLSDFNDKKALLVIFMCRHCPYVQHVKEELGKLGQDYKDKDIAIVAISSNDANKYPDDRPESLKEFAKQENFLFPLLYDESQAVAKEFTAACTPDLFLFDQNRKLVYRGQIDDSRPGNDEEVNGKDIRAAIEAVLNGRQVPEEQKPSTGCNIKWKEGNEPEYYSSL